VFERPNARVPVPLQSPLSWRILRIVCPGVPLRICAQVTGMKRGACESGVVEYVPGTEGAVSAGGGENLYYASPRNTMTLGSTSLAVGWQLLRWACDTQMKREAGWWDLGG